MKAVYYQWAEASFEAARRLPDAEMAALQRWHGHSFRAQAWEPFEVPEPVCGSGLDARLALQLAALDYQALNDFFPDPSDPVLTQWIWEGMPTTRRIRLAAAAGQGTIGPGPDVSGFFQDRFESAHRLPHVPEGHKCGRMHGHGFGIELRFRPERRPGETRLAWKNLRERLHQRCLNDLEGLENPTSEVLAQWIWDRLVCEAPTLLRVTILETPTCGTHYDGTVHRIWKTRFFDSATLRLRMPEGNWGERLHGHTYGLQIGIRGALDPRYGWAMDFAEVSRQFDPLIDQLDHRPLHERTPTGATPEVLGWIAEQAVPRLPALEWLALKESPTLGWAWGATDCLDAWL